MKAKTSLANLYWFPLAALYAALVLPLSVGGLLNWFPIPAGLEQAWILVGWIYIALSLINPLMPITQALHAMTIGALGTLTLTVMARGRTFRVLRDCNSKPFIYLLPLLISFAAVLRLNAIQLGYSSSLMLSTLCWSLAFTSLFIWLLWLAKVKSAQ